MDLKWFILIFTISLILSASSNSFAIDRISATHTEGGCRIIAQDSVVYLFYRTDGSISMSLYNISNPYSPEFINRFENISGFELSYGYRYFTVKDSFIIVANDYGELIYKLNSFDSLSLVTTIDCGPGFRLVQVRDTLLFLGRLFDGVMIYDISNIYEPEILLGGDDFGGLSLHSFNVFDEYIAQSNGFTLKIFTLVNPDSIIEVYNLGHAGDWWHGDICYKDGFIYWALGGGICVVDIRDPDYYRIYPGSEDGYGPGSALCMNIHDSLLITRTQSGNHVYINVIVEDTIILNPPIENIYCSSFSGQRDFAIQSHFLYVPNRDSLYVYDLSSVTGINENSQETNDKSVEILQASFNCINFRYNSSSPAKIRVFDILGNLRFERDISSPGAYQIDDLDIHNSGVYLLNITSESVRFNSKFLLIK